MKYITFKTLKIKNFLSVGEDDVCINFNKGLHIITGINRDKEDRRNGVGKCVDPETKINIKIKHQPTLSLFLNLIKVEDTSNVTIKQVYDFYKMYPASKGNVEVMTRFGFYPIDEAAITAKDEQVFLLKTHNDYTLKCSGGHRVHNGVEFINVRDLHVGDKILTDNGHDEIVQVLATETFIDLYDIQVRDVQEYFSNGIVSHNSTIADALYFSIFGNTLREIKKQYISNNLTDGTTAVELSFTVNDPHYGVNDFHIVRTLNPSRCSVFKNGGNKTRDTINNTNLYIETVLSSSAEVFQNCVIMTLNNHIPFMAKNKIEKRKFIEKIFNLEIFSKMLTELKTEQHQIKQEFDINITRLEEVSKYINTQKEQSDNFNLNKENKIKNIENNLSRYQKDLDTAIQRYSAIQALDDTSFVKTLADIDRSLKASLLKREDNNKNIIELKLNIKNNISKYHQIGTDSASCPVCLRSIEKHDIEHIEYEKNNIKNEINQLNNSLAQYNDEQNIIDCKIKKLDNAAAVIRKKIADIEKEKYSINHIKESIEHIKNYIIELQADLKNVTVDNNTFSNAVDVLEQKVASINTELSSIKHKLDLLDVVRFIVSEEGVKSYIVKKILRNFNSKLTHYLKRLDSNSICIFNEYFEEEILNEKGKMCLYNNFSGAERKAIDLACLFSFMDMRKSQGDVHYNLSFYDELFDSSLDEKGVDLVLEILNERVTKHNECVFVISHRKESIKSATGDIIFLEKHNGITKRVNFVD